MPSGRVRVRKRIVTALAALLLASGAVAQQPTQSQLLVPPDAQLEIMIKTAAVALNHANLTGNYAVLRDLAEIFEKLRKRKFDIGPIVLLPPKLSRKPWIDSRRLLRLQGFFETRPERVDFNLAFSVVGNQWRLFAIGVTTSKPEAIEPLPKDEQKR